MPAFNILFSYDTVASAPIHVSWTLRTIFYPSHLLPYHITLVETMDNGERGIMSQLPSSILEENDGRAGDRTSQFLTVLKPCTLPSEIHGLGKVKNNDDCIKCACQ